jgi:hypothetical protein
VETSKSGREMVEMVGKSAVFSAQNAFMGWAVRRNSDTNLVPGVGLEPTRPMKGTTDFKSAFLEASAASSVHQMCPQYRSLNRFEPQT